MSVNEQHEAAKRARKHRNDADELAAWAFRTEPAKPADIQIAAGLGAVIHLLLAIEDRLAYGSQSMLDGTVSCHDCRVILLEENAGDHYKWHDKNEG